MPSADGQCLLCWCLSCNQSVTCNQSDGHALPSRFLRHCHCDSLSLAFVSNEPQDGAEDCSLTQTRNPGFVWQTPEGQPPSCGTHPSYHEPSFAPTGCLNQLHQCTNALTNSGSLARDFTRDMTHLPVHPVPLALISTVFCCYGEMKRGR